MNELDIHRPFTRALTPTADVLIMAAVAVCTAIYSVSPFPSRGWRRQERRSAGPSLSMPAERLSSVCRHILRHAQLLRPCALRTVWVV